jgi:transposase
MNIHKLNEKKRRVKDKLIVGIDLAKRDNYAVLMLPDGVVLGKPFRFGNTAGAFEKLWNRLVKVRDEQKLSGILLSMEATGCYWEPLARFFRDYPVETVFVQAKIVKKSREMMDLSHTKNDPKDAYVIAQITSEGKFLKIRMNDGVWAELRSLGLMRADLRKAWVTWGNRVRSLIDKYWPERERALKDCLKPTSRAVLEKCPFPKDVLELGIEGLTEVVREGSNKTRGLKMAQALYSEAVNSVGVKEGQEAAKFELRNALEIFCLLSKKIEEVEQKLTECLKRTSYYEPLVSVPGLSAVGAALLLAETGDPSQYRSAKEWVKLAGLNLIENQSGKLKREGKRISRVGRPVLRHVLYTLSMPLRTHNPEFRVHYLELRRRGKVSMKAVVASMHKLLRLTFALCRSGTAYELPEGASERAQELKAEWANKKAAA